MNSNRFAVDIAPWEQQKDALRGIRREVFVIEQQVPECDEWDDQDSSAVHFLATEQSTGLPVGTARLLTSGKITRMAVRKPFRQVKVGSMLMSAVLQHAATCGLTHLYLDAQTTAVGFYTKFGFVPEGEPFWDAGILHLRMQLNTVGDRNDR